MAEKPDLKGLSRCFQPRQWFSCGFDNPESDRLMWVYKLSGNNRWTVGFFCPDGTWMAESEFDDKEQAAARVNYLNGGNA